MPKAVLGILAVVAVAGWATAFVFFTKSEDLGGELETSEVEREKLAEDLELAQNESKKHIKAASRLDEIGQKLGAAKDKVAAYERLIQAKQDELVVVIDELATLESNLSERKAQVLRTEAEELEGKAEPNQSEPLAEPESESQTLPEAEPSAAEPEPQVMSEAEPSAAEPEPQVMSEAEPSAAEPEPQAMSEAEPSAAEPEETDRVAEARRRFQIVDQDGDGKIDEFEFKMNSIKLLGLD